jgi:hypothetical protein
MFSKKILIVVASFLVIFLSRSAFAGVLFEDSFETGDYTHRDPISGAEWVGRNYAAGDYVSVSSDRAHTGTYSLKFHYDGNLNLADDAFAEMRYTTGTSGQTDWYLRYYIYYPLNFFIRDADGPDNNKVGTTWGESYTDNGGKFNMEFKRGLSVGFKLRRNRTWPHATLQCSGIIAVGPNQPRWTMTSDYLGRWVCWEFHYKMDDGTGNGQVQLFVDGNLKISMDNLSYIDAPCDPPYSRFGYLMGWANSGFNEDTDVYIDDVVFSTSYIGPSAPDPNRTPFPPTDFKEVN